MVSVSRSSAIAVGIVKRYLVYPQPITDERRYRQEMSTKPKPQIAHRSATEQNLARNLAFLMVRKGWTQEQVAAKAGIVQKTVSNVLTGAHKTTIETAEALGRAFGVTGWHMISPYLIKDVEGDGTLARMIDGYMFAPADAQQIVMQIVEREARGKKK